MDYAPRIVDADDNPIEVGTRVRLGTEHVWTVTKITDIDGDVDDEGRGIAIPPFVYVNLGDAPLHDDAVAADGDEQGFRTYFTGQGWWDEDAPFKCDDMEVVA
jgi:hypothetical protein